MSNEFTVRPFGGWAAGDRAYCVRGTLATYPTLEAGKVYIVADVRPEPGCIGFGLALAGVRLPTGFEAISSGRFVRLCGQTNAIRQIADQTRRGWRDAYNASLRSLSALAARCARTR